MYIVKTWCESTKEGEEYLQFNGYTNAERVSDTDYYVCESIGNKLDDVEVMFEKEGV